MHRAARLGTTIAAAVALTAFAVAPAANAAERVVAPGSVPRWATAARERGAVDPHTTLDLTVELALRDPADARAFARAVSDPASPRFGRFLTADAFRRRFAASDRTVAAVRDFLAAAGLRIVAVSRTNRTLRVRGSVARIERAFRTRLARFSHDGALLRAPSRPLRLPRQVASAVTAVSGLTEVRARPVDAPPPAATVNAGPCSAFFGELLATTLPLVDGAAVPYIPCGYTGAQLRSAYDVAPLRALGVDGRGVRVAIVDAYAAPTIQADVRTYAAAHGDGGYADGQLAEIVQRPQSHGAGDPSGDACGERGWYREETLDVEALHGLAPGAAVVYVGARSCLIGDLLAGIQAVVDGHLADVVSNSWGFVGEDLPPAEVQAYDTTFVQAAAEGIGVLFATGDAGDQIVATGRRQADFPSTDPWVTAVGGTALGVDASGERLFETAWQTGSSPLVNGVYTPAPPGHFNGGGGGGESRLFAQPAYQAGVVPASIATFLGGAPGRTTPDVALDADPQTGMVVGETQTFADGTARYGEFRLGGTSLATPLMAGIAALADEAAGRPLGFLNPRLYGLAGSAALTDVVGGDLRYVVRNDFVNHESAAGGMTTTLRSLDLPQTILARPGYDDATGLGAPDAAALVQPLLPSDWSPPAQARRVSPSAAKSARPARTPAS
jgi:subtilase family serine protease